MRKLIALALLALALAGGVAFVRGERFDPRLTRVAAARTAETSASRSHPPCAGCSPSP